MPMLSPRCSHPILRMLCFLSTGWCCAFRERNEDHKTSATPQRNVGPPADDKSAMTPINHTKAAFTLYIRNGYMPSSFPPNSILDDLEKSICALTCPVHTS